MKVLIIESCEAKIERNYKNTSIVHVRNSVIMADYLDADIVSVETEIPAALEKEYDVIICMYASGYMMYNKYLAILLKNKDARVFWLVNDHAVPDNILLRKWVEECGIGYDMICNNQRESYIQSMLRLVVNEYYLNDWIENWHVVNLNCMIFDTSFARSVDTDLFRHEKSDCVYYGTFREGRLNDMLDYNGANYGISTSKKNVVKYKEHGVEARFGGKLNWQKGHETLYNYKYSIYFEDEHTHTNYAFMANRFYECLMLDVLLFFDYRCTLVMNKSNYNVHPYMIVHNAEELNAKMNEVNHNERLYAKLLETQHSNFDRIVKEKQETLEQIKRVISTPKQVVVRSEDDKVEKKARVKVEKEISQTNLFEIDEQEES